MRPSIRTGNRDSWFLVGRFAPTGARFASHRVIDLPPERVIGFTGMRSRRLILTCGLRRALVHESKLTHSRPNPEPTHRPILYQYCMIPADQARSSDSGRCTRSPPQSLAHLKSERKDHTR